MVNREEINNLSSEIIEKAKGIKLFFLDVDGVMTDGSIYLNEMGESVKKFNSLDGYGIKLLQDAGIEPVVITGRNSKAIRNRCTELQITKAYYGIQNKLQIADQYLDSSGFNWSEAAGMGDDWPDLPILMRVKLSFSPPQAHKEVLSRVNYVCTASAGMGAVREACDLLIMAKGNYTTVLNQMLM